MIDMGLFDSIKRKSSVYDEGDEAYESVVASAPLQTVSDTLPTKQPVRSSEPVTGALRMQVLRPTEFAEAPRVADCLKAGQAVVLNLEEMEEKDARRLIDYIAGVLYAVDGKIERPAQRTFLLTPRGVSVASEDVARLDP